MLKVRLIPNILLKDGRAVKGVQFGSYRDVGHPVQNAKIYDAQGADELIFLDIGSAREGHSILYDIITATAEQCFMPLTVGGGVRTLEDIRKLLLAGADKVAINTSAMTNPQFISESAAHFGSQCILVSVDVRRVDGTPRVVTHGGTRVTDIDPVRWAARAAELGAGEILLTSVDREGMRQGYDLELVRSVADAVTVPVIASGGVGTLQHLVDGVTIGHATAVSAGTIFHFTDQSLIKARAYMRMHGLEVRLG